ncbi:MAG: DUF2490 domain-containing protein [Flavobacteriales bacterium]|nr:DUF2490 domain-containing protein [Flavobacteriales bacterium]
MKNISALIILQLSVFCFVPNIQAQHSSTGNWFQYFGIHPTASRWLVLTEAQHRNYNFAGDLQQFMVRAGAGYNLTPSNHNLMVGYAYILSENYLPDSDTEKIRTFENRLFGQFAFKHPMGRVMLGHRYRAEYRQFGHQSESWRARYQLWFQFPLNKSVIESGTLYLMVSDEIFLNTTHPQFDRNRLYGAFGYCISRYLSVELGMMRQSLSTTARNQLQIALFNRIPFKTRSQE